MRRIAAAGVLLAAWWICGSALAQQPKQVWRTLRQAGAHALVLETAWGGSGPDAAGAVTLLAGKRRTRLARGGFFRTDVATRGNHALVAVASGGAQRRIVLALVSIAEDGTAEKPRLVEVPSPGGDRGTPTAIIACADPAGFTVLWQELTSAQSRDAVTFLARIDPSGRWLVRPKQVPVPWSLGAIVHHQGGYHLAIFFDGASPDQTRLCTVRLTAAGQPREHPWWSSAPQLIDEVQLLSSGGRVHAYFLGGPDGATLKSTDLTDVRQWGHQPPAAQSHGKLGADQEFTLRPAANGTPEIVRKRLSVRR
ncbi:MAG: hypothetical protein JRI23_13650 [Deltaproteobacteria bacterium]|nr:hypothetical protein [Deltaproteobacteria bacterium]MBW2532773.1 hypothetical protein [Deltaproteobacteria bacterium]